jgi:hypothetical protein
MEDKIYFEMKINGEKKLLYILKSEIEKLNRLIRPEAGKQ